MVVVRCGVSSVELNVVRCGVSSVELNVVRCGVSSVELLFLSWFVFSNNRLCRLKQYFGLEIFIVSVASKEAFLS